MSIYGKKGSEKLKFFIGMSIDLKFEFKLLPLKFSISTLNVRNLNFA